MKFATPLTVVFEELSFKNFIFFKIKCCHGNQTKSSLVIKHINWIDNHPTAKYGSHHFKGYGEKAISPFSHYKSMGVFCCRGNQTKRQICRFLAVFNCPYPYNICTNLEFYCFSGFGEVVIKKLLFFFLNLMLPWKPNEMATGHETHKLDRQSSNDHNC